MSLIKSRLNSLIKQKNEKEQTIHKKFQIFMKNLKHTLDEQVFRNRKHFFLILSSFIYIFDFDVFLTKFEKLHTI